ncbi:chromosome partitioning protein, ATP-binding subunit [Burkholderia pseudomallei]|nr:chromosome partitioning protein, ATP-binding subunit [Burkholderia pseudomallei]CAJ8897521.1 chromosome partitioning protein, ATP-binding subunit [Burkholderia pseudomallei]
MRTTGSSGAMTLLTEFDQADGRELRSLRLVATEDGKSVLLIEVDERKPGIHREVRYEITPAPRFARTARSCPAKRTAPSRSPAPRRPDPATVRPHPPAPARALTVLAAHSLAA